MNYEEARRIVDEYNVEQRAIAAELRAKRIAGLKAEVHAEFVALVGEATAKGVGQWIITNADRLNDDELLGAETDWYSDSYFTGLGQLLAGPDEQ